MPSNRRRPRCRPEGRGARGLPPRRRQSASIRSPDELHGGGRAALGPGGLRQGAAAGPRGEESPSAGRAGGAGAAEASPEQAAPALAPGSGRRRRPSVGGRGGASGSACAGRGRPEGEGRPQPFLHGEARLSAKESRLRRRVAEVRPESFSGGEPAVAGRAGCQASSSSAQKKQGLLRQRASSRGETGAKELGTVRSEAQNTPQTVHLEKLNVLLSSMSTPVVILEIQTLCKALKYRCCPPSKPHVILGLKATQVWSLLQQVHHPRGKHSVLDCKTTEPSFKCHLPASHPNHNFQRSGL